ncbi:uncharacterized protein F4812DRAFT_467483 [Daldinia caldariorum]|uniref:uncharacterized protein n=1 Tax=Daldinia caldariorum TaxID=326644 RepID=UPI0020074F23|nr:uncharacterized protein F4812DRAFT_467483 [Daldinia caldariorum]KAI1471387.1 hypothetical protein F4812DRAFT_467483 [Daldinia caldariorum]
MDATSQYHGSLIAFEGPQDTISTQLRLLPSSPNILIIPPLQRFMKEEGPRLPFHAQSHILAVHNACCDRAEVAREFLQNSTQRNKRLVFMNGGTASAQMECITNISKHLTNGDFVKAERIFHRLVRDGVAGLQSRNFTDMNFEPSQLDGEDGDMASDPASEAMRAAEALDLQTASLQPNNEIDLTNINRSRSTSVVTYRAVDDFQNITPFYVFGAQKWQGRNTCNSDPPQTPRRSHTTLDSRKVTRRILEPTGSRISEFDSQPRFADSPDEGCPGSKRSTASLDLTSRQSFKLESMPNTPSICEAFAVDVRPSATTASRMNIRPVDRIYSSAIRNQDILLCSFPEPPRSRPQSMDASTGPHQSQPALRSKFTTETPRSTFSTPNRSMVRRNPPCPLKLYNSPLRPVAYVDRGTSPRNNYVDRGTTTEQGPTNGISKSDTRDSISLYIEGPIEDDTQESYEAVLPMVENLVILFKSDKHDPRLEATVQSFREGKYPVSKSPPEMKAEETSHPSKAGDPPEPEHAAPENKRHSRVQHAELASAYRMNSDEYDPFAYGKYPEPSRVWPFKPSMANHGPSTPPTPAQTPPLAVRKLDKCFHDFPTTDCRTAVCMQNSLRSILNIYFPPEDTGYHQFNFPLLPELSSLWKPVFREADPGTVMQRKRKVDLILAVGAQQGVDREFLGAITGSLEKLGTKPNGVSRSGRLDLRFLIASAMQVFTAQPLTNQTQDNPFSNPLLLATLIIPHLETYMAAHSATRFLLLEYPPEHLATVLALQRLVGVDLLKVAGVLYSEDTSPRPYPGFRVPARTNPHLRTESGPGLLRSTSRSGATLLAPTRSKHGETPPFAKANFLLTSSANESEIATLISTIWKILIDISAFYIPEGMASSRASMHSERDSHSHSHHHPRSHHQGRPLAQTPLINSTPQPGPVTSASAIMGFRRQRAGEEEEYDDNLSAEYNSGTVYTEANPPPPPPKNPSSQSPSSSTPLPLRSSSLSSHPPPPPPPSQPPTPKPRHPPITTTTKPPSTSKPPSSCPSVRSARTARSQRNKLRSLLGREPDGRTVDEDRDEQKHNNNSNNNDRSGEKDRDHDGDWDACGWDEEDARLAAEARKYMPLYGQRGGPRKGSSRKALKWLGLAT